MSFAMASLSASQVTSNAILIALVACILSILHYIFSRHSIAYLQGPPSPSQLVGTFDYVIPIFYAESNCRAGNLQELRNQTDSGRLEGEWYAKYGNAVAIKGCYNVSF
jgi:hypothetical protein